MRHFLLKTHELTALSPEQLPLPSLGEAGDFTLAKSTILPLLYSMTQGMGATLKAVEELCLHTTDHEAPLANTLANGSARFAQRIHI